MNRLGGQSKRKAAWDSETDRLIELWEDNLFALIRLILHAGYWRTITWDREDELLRRVLPNITVDELADLRSLNEQALAARLGPPRRPRRFGRLAKQRLIEHAVRYGHISGQRARELTRRLSR